ncbi:hypothetical protein CKO28_05060 [Rhodovibrio sodomensis]|uniref:ATP-binding protein n=1 Tax=Rhodovibrio sodomensis TaxID=1088 RepID=A0ABS1DCT3_9PROT|nr:ATP-binding protein [Rhodovibrio sodomensis]MBK1667398.1 hypothetical protein [Rhodovibrio sodomensis]
MTQPRQETRTFGMHPNLLMDVIRKQAGSISKALLEAVMNSGDAGATRCEIEIDADRFSIRDDGRGFQNEAEITAHFETFGTPHEEGDAVWGRYRMGRGQLMSFGRNKWASNVFRMEVDVKNRGLDYDLHVVDAKHAVAGCQIEVELYEPLLPSDLDRTLREFKDMAAWVSIPVIVNGKILSTDPATASWDIVDEDAYIRIASSRATLDVYNLGVLVTRMPAHTYGVGGVVVSRKRLDVNFARNDVQRSCPVFRRIAKHLQAHANQQNATKARLTDAERQNLADQAVAGEFDRKTLPELKLITDVAGRQHKISVLNQFNSGSPGRFGSQVVIAPRGDQLAETAQQRGLCLAISQETLERFDAANGRELLERLGAAMDRAWGHGYFSRGYAQIPVVSRDSLSDVISDNHVLLKARELKPTEKLMLETLTYSNHYIASAVSRSPLVAHSGMRKLVLGVSETALAWTDGSSFIAFDRTYVAQQMKRGYAGAYQLALTLLHEYLHDSADTESHIHDHAFYEAYHELSGDHDSDPVGRAAEAIAKRFAFVLQKEGRKPSSAYLKTTDHNATIERTRDRLDLD